MNRGFFGAAVLVLVVLGALPQQAADPRGALVEMKARLMAADYGADLEGLRRLREELEPFFDDPEHGPVARYWAGFAHWRTAINEPNVTGGTEGVEAELRAALTQFEAAIVDAPDLVDAHAAIASATGWLQAIAAGRGDVDAIRSYAGRAQRALARAKELAPESPRVLWVEGGIVFNTPAQFGSSQQTGMELYRRAIEAADHDAVHDSPLPDWGKPEAIMALAWSYVYGDAPNPHRAKELAEQALELEPEWFYVREILIPEIEERLR